MTTPAIAGPEESNAASNSSASVATVTAPYAAPTSLLAQGLFRAKELKPAFAQADPNAAPTPTTVKVVAGADIPSLYFFRGYRQESDPEFTFQPYVDLGVSGEKASFNVGVWNSWHTGSLKDSGAGFYETDLYAAATVGFFKTTYTAYTYPEIDDSTIHEVMFSATLPNVLAPSVAIAFEFAKPEGLDKGIYLELGIAPALPLGDDAPVTITIPVKLGLSVKDYYGDDTFGYFSGGVTIGKSINDHFEVHAGVTGYGFGDVLKAVNNDKAGYAVVSGGFSVSF